MKPLYYYAGRVFGLGMRMVPRSYAFVVAASTAELLMEPVRRTRSFRSLRNLRLNSERDLALHLLLRAMTTSRTPFTRSPRISGEHLLEEALASGRGTMVVSAHARLSPLVLRHLYDRGHAPTIVAGEAGMSLAGTDMVAPAVQPSPTVLLRIRSRLREGGIVCAMLDRLNTKGKQTRTVKTAAGPVRISDSAFRLAVRCNAQVLFSWPARRSAACALPSPPPRKPRPARRRR